MAYRQYEESEIIAIIMSLQALFKGLVFDEQGRIVETGMVGDEAHYIIDDHGFHRHVAAEEVDRRVVDLFVEQVRQHRDLAVEQGLRMMGKDDLFTKAALDASIDNISAEQILQQGLPQQARDMMAMMGFRITVNYHGEVIDIEQPGTIAPEED